MSTNIRRHGRAWCWVPPVYFAEGLPFVLISSVSLVMFSSFDVPVEKSLLWVSLFSLPWTLRPLWVPLIDHFGTPRRWTLVMQLLLAAAFTAVGAAVAAGADGLIIEVHNNPPCAKCDGAQSLTPESFDQLAKQLLKLKSAMTGI